MSSAFVISGGTVVDPAAVSPAHEVHVVDRCVSAPTADVRRRLDATGLLVVPSYVDLQCNGLDGIDLTAEPTRLWDVGTRLPAAGVGSFLPTLVSPSPEVVAAAQRTLAARPREYEGAEPLGLHLEGPLLNPARAGAHPEQALRAVADAHTAAWSRRDGVLVVTVAPELPGVLPLIAVLVRRGVCVSLGHSDATSAQALAAVEAGARGVTHLFNAMRRFSHRDPGLAGLALADERLRCGVIADGVHSDPITVAAAWRALGPDRLHLVTDSSAAAGAADAAPTLAGVPLTLSDGAPRTADGRLAGSALSMDQAVRNLRCWTGCSTSDAVRAAALNPARHIGVTGKARLAPGADADVTLLHPDLTVAATLLRGRVVYGEVPWKS